MGVALMGGGRARREEGPSEEGYWINLEALFEKAE